MTKFRLEAAMSVDGFSAGPHQSIQHPLGIGGGQLHEWGFANVAWRRQHGLEGGEDNASTAVIEESLENIGATVMGRNMFGGGPGPWGEEPWEGWWGEDPPFHGPVFVLTNHEREPLEKQGGTTFFCHRRHRVRIRARQAGGRRQGRFAGRRRPRCPAVPGGGPPRRGATTPGSGPPRRRHPALRHLAGAGVELEPLRAVAAPGVTHLKYRVVH